MKYIILTILILVSFACSDFLDENMQGTYSGDTFYKTAAHASLALTACYEPLAFKTINNSLWVFGDVASDDAIKGGNPGDQSEISYIDAFDIHPDNGYLENIWKHYYEGIFRCNELIAHLPGIGMNEETQNIYTGEAKFLRAYYYFILVNIFGDIPLKTAAIESTADLHVPLSTADDIYKQIKDDLNEAVEALPADWTSAEAGRIRKGSALGMLAKAYLYTEDYDDALIAIDQLEALGKYSLMGIYNMNFTQADKNNGESIFEIQHLSQQVPMSGNALNQWFAPQAENGYYFNSPTQNLVDEYETADIDTVYDPRLDYTIGREGKNWLNGEAFDPAWSPTGYMGKKHIQPLAEIGKGTKGDGDLNYTYMRYADILLMKAEALNESPSHSQAEAIIPLNLVRKRARESYLYDETLEGYGSIPTGLLPDVTEGSKEEIRAAIQHERRVELAMEFHRFFDLMRYGQETAEAALAGTSFSYETNRYFPIPQSERDINKAID